MFGGMVMTSRSWRTGGRGAAGALALMGALGVAVVDGAARTGDVGWNRHIASGVSASAAPGGARGGATGDGTADVAGHRGGTGDRDRRSDGGAPASARAGDVGWNRAAKAVQADVGWNRAVAVVPVAAVGRHSSGQGAATRDVGWN